LCQPLQLTTSGP